jgi:hypothetical protein
MGQVNQRIDPDQSESDREKSEESRQNGQQGVEVASAS